MATLRLKKVKVGMELGEPVSNTQNKVLFKAGVIITKKHLMTLKAWGITEVNINIAEQDLLANDDAIVTAIEKGLPDDVKHEIDYRFQKTDRNDPLIRTLYHLILERELNQRRRQFYE